VPSASTIPLRPRSIINISDTQIACASVSSCYFLDCPSCYWARLWTRHIMHGSACVQCSSKVSHTLKLTLIHLVLADLSCKSCQACGWQLENIGGAGISFRVRHARCDAVMKVIKEDLRHMVAAKMNDKGNVGKPTKNNNNKINKKAKLTLALESRTDRYRIVPPRLNKWSPKMEADSMLPV
jgi:hypothetical protein